MNHCGRRLQDRNAAEYKIAKLRATLHHVVLVGKDVVACTAAQGIRNTKLMPPPILKIAVMAIFGLLYSIGSEGQHHAQAVRKPVLAAGTVKENPKDGLKYAWIPPGTFQMGCSPGDTNCSPMEKSPHPIKITKGFWIGQTEVTVGAYKRFAATPGRQMPPMPVSNKDWANDQMPIVNAGWDEAQAYCGWSGGRLPTEAQWEYAARGGSKQPSHGPLDEVAWYSGNSGGGMHEVAQRRANSFGVFDALGNVWEWVSDLVVGRPGLDFTHKENYNLLRGGFWNSKHWVVRASYRTAVNRGEHFDDTGFRCSREAAP